MEQTETVDYNDLLRVHEGSQWTFFTSKPHQEMNLYEALRRQNIPCYLPQVKKMTKYSRRSYTRYVPMFSGYVFASTRANGFDFIGLNSSLKRCFFLDKGCAATLLRDLITVRKFEVLAQDYKVEIKADFDADQAITLPDGYFKDENAVIRHCDNHDEVTVQLISLARFLSVQLPSNFLSQCV